TYHDVHKLAVSPDSLRGVPIGKPLDNVRLFVVNDQWNLQPVGVGGELYIGGECLAREYLNQPEMTAEKFVRSPIVKDENGVGERLYRTGDRVRWLPDGSIEFIGRLDHQVKIRGFRIELGEIESQLLKQASVQDCVVLAKEDDTGDKRLIAYTVRSAEGLDMDSNVIIGLLRDRLSENLPEYMVPASFTFVDEIPLTPNGKINRSALLALEDESVFQETYVAPRNDKESALCDIWADILQVEQV
ncbi:AMP-binding enzyme, partial [Alteromonas sp. a30]|uniref:AMP-binding enzyme n=1 Tax=Alteromonas sp. a30 TaxID=2730917 RepID=UPI00227F8FF2|nr:AMP-binding protein [Alteromonas sp. a30]